MQKALFICFTVLIAVNCVTSRWLPTRSGENNLEKLRELLQQFLEVDMENTKMQNKYMYKRDVAKEFENLQMADNTAAKTLNG